MGRHSRSGYRRSLAPWVIITAAVVAAVVAVTTVFLVAANRRPAVAYCTGTVVLHVAASPAAGPAVSAAAAAYDATRPVARSTCVATTVRVDDGAATTRALIGGWRNRPTPGPALWVADSPADVATVADAVPALLAGRSPKPLATTPVVLAVRTSDAAALAGLDWRLADPASRPAGGTFTVAFPDPGDNPTSVRGLEAVLAAARPAAADPLAAVTTAQVAQLTGSVRLPPTIGDPAADPAGGGVRDGEPPTSTAAALTALRNGSAGFTAVPATEAAVADLDQGSSPAVTAIYPEGPTVLMQLLVTPLGGAWVDQTATAAAAGFSAYLADPAGRQILADHGLRVPGTTPARAPAGIEPSRPVTGLADAGPDVRAALAQAYAQRFPTASTTSGPSGSGPESAGVSTPTAPSGSSGGLGGRAAGARSGLAGPPTTGSSRPAGPSTSTSTSPVVLVGPGTRVTFLIDSSAAMAVTEGGRTRAAAVTAALSQAFAAVPGAAAGLWTVSSTDGSTGFAQRVSTGPLTAQSRAAAIAQVLAAQPLTGDCWLYAAVPAAYRDPGTLPTNGTGGPGNGSGADSAGRPATRLVVITASSDATPGLSRGAVIAAVSGAAGNGVELDIIGIGGDVNALAMSDIAQTGLGGYSALPTSALADRLTTLLRS